MFGLQQPKNSKDSHTIRSEPPIQDVAGKSFSRILKQRLLAQVGPRILQFPQFAYVSGRSTEGAIARVVEHCNNVREELGHCKRNIYSKRDGHKAMAINGGIQLAVDMSTAFDRVPRSALRQALVWAGASAQLVEVIDKLHDQCGYHIQHAGFRGTVNVKRGVRQGCTLAPVLTKAKLAAVRHDTKELYAVVRRLAPKHRRRNVRIRKPDGMPLCAEAEYEEILEYFTGFFSQQGFDFTASEPVAISSDRITITSSEVCSALKANKIGKAVPVQHAPASAWIACAGISTLTEAVADEATGCINSERPISKLWSDCFLALIPKPNKALCRPENLNSLYTFCRRVCAFMQ